MFIVELFELWVVVSRESARGTGMRGVLMNHVSINEEINQAFTIITVSPTLHAKTPCDTNIFFLSRSSSQGRLLT